MDSEMAADINGAGCKYGCSELCATSEGPLSMRLDPQRSELYFTVFELVLSARGTRWRKKKVNQSVDGHGRLQAFAWAARAGRGCDWLDTGGRALWQRASKRAAREI